MLDDRAGGADARHPLALDVDVGAEPEGQPQAVDLLRNPLLHLGGGGHAGGDDPAGEGLLADVHRQRVDAAVAGELLLGAGLNPAGAQGVGAGELGAVLFIQCLYQLVVQRFGKAVAHRADGRSVDADLLGICFADKAGQLLQLAAGLGIVVALGVDGGKPLVRAAKVIGGKARLVVDKDQAGQPSGGQAQRGDHGGEDRILVVLPAEDDPHVKAGLLHQPGQQVMDAERKLIVHNLVLFFECYSLSHGRCPPVKLISSLL